MAGLTLREAVHGDSPALESLFQATSMGSRIKIKVERNPDYFAGARVQADEPCVRAAFDEHGRAIGLFSAGRRRVWLDEVTDFRYLCDLRIHPDFQRGTLLARGFRLLCDEVFTPGEWAQTLVLEDNLHALEMLTSRRAGLPEYRKAGIYHSWILPSQGLGADCSVPVRRATLADLAEMQSLLDSAARRRSFAHLVNLSELGHAGWRDMEIGDFLVAVQRGRITGMIGLWDQSAFQRLRVNAYSRAVAATRPLWNAWAKAVHQVPLPLPGKTVPLRKATAIACTDDDPRILRALLAEALKAPNEKMLLFGLSAADPLAAALKGLRGRMDRGHHFLVGWEGHPPAWSEPFSFDPARI